MPGDENFQLGQFRSPQQKLLAQRAAVTGNQYITICGAEQDAKPRFVVGICQRRSKNRHGSTIIGDFRIRRNVHGLICQGGDGRSHTVHIFRVRQEHRIRRDPGQEVGDAACVIPVVMGQDDAVQAENALTQQGLGGFIGGDLIVAAAAVHQPGFSAALEDDALPLPHIENRDPAAVQQRLAPGQDQGNGKSKNAAAQQRPRVLLPAAQEHQQQDIEKHQPDDDVHTFGIHRRQGKLCKNV